MTTDLRPRLRLPPSALTDHHERYRVQRDPGGQRHGGDASHLRSPLPLSRVRRQNRTRSGGFPVSAVPFSLIFIYFTHHVVDRCHIPCCSPSPQNALIVGSSPSFDCSATLPSGDFNVVNSDGHRAPRPLPGVQSAGWSRRHVARHCSSRDAVTFTLWQFV